MNAVTPLNDIVVEKQLLAKLALHHTSCAGCIASVRALLARPLRYITNGVGDAAPHADYTAGWYE